MVLNRLSSKWKNYKYRFVPWLIYNFKNRTTRTVDGILSDKIVSDEEIINQLFHILEGLSKKYPISWEGLPQPSAQLHKESLKVMKELCGYCVECRPSKVGGKGVFLNSEEQYIESGQLVSLYPGLFYLPFQPILVQSISNPFIFRCLDGSLLDGNNKNLSKILFRSCVGRDRIGAYLLADKTWLTEYPLNPLNVGQFINNASKEFGSNVAYQELSIPSSLIKIEHRRFLPNLWYSSFSNTSNLDAPVKLIAIVTTKRIRINEELFSNYFTVIK